MCVHLCKKKNNNKNKKKQYDCSSLSGENTKCSAGMDKVVTGVMGIVAATDLFSFGNQCPRQESRSLTDQSTGRASSA